jgi:hypothetical protein
LPPEKEPTKMEKKQDAKLISLLQSGNENTILHTIQQLRVSGNPDYLPFLFPLLLPPAGAVVRKAVLDLLNDLKVQSAVPLLVETIEDPQYSRVKKELIASCWQNGLDFSDQLSFFAELVIDNDFDIAFEAFTVIDSMESIPAGPDREKLTERILNVLDASTGAKASLLRELYDLLR